MSTRQLSGDTKEQIEMCLNCPYTRCVDCIGQGFSTIERRRKVRDINYDAVMRPIDWELLLAYPTSGTDAELAKKIGKAQSTTCTARIRLGLPSPRLLSEQEKRELIRPWMDKLYAPS